MSHVLQRTPGTPWHALTSDAGCAGTRPTTRRIAGLSCRRRPAAPRVVVEHQQHTRDDNDHERAEGHGAEVPRGTANAPANACEWVRIASEAVRFLEAAFGDQRGLAPRIRVKLRDGLKARWHIRTAHLLYDDDPRERQHWLANQVPSRARNARAVPLRNPTPHCSD